MSACSELLGRECDGACERDPQRICPYAYPPQQTETPDLPKGPAMKPTIGRIVIYTSRTGDYEVPAIITATVDSLNPKGVELGHIPPLTASMPSRHV